MTTTPSDKIVVELNSTLNEREVIALFEAQNISARIVAPPQPVDNKGIAPDVIYVLFDSEGLIVDFSQDTTFFYGRPGCTTFAYHLQPQPAQSSGDAEINQQLAQVTHERDLLAKAIGDAALKAKIWNGETSLTGPHLLMLAEDLADCALQPTAQSSGEAEPDTYERYVVIREGEQNAACDEYFKVRKFIPTRYDEGFFNAGFQRGYDARDKNKQPPSPPAQDDAELLRACWVVLDESGEPVYCASYERACHEHINSACEFDIDAGKWIVRKARLSAAGDAREVVAHVGNKFGDPERFAERELLFDDNVIQKLPIGTRLYAAPQPTTWTSCAEQIEDYRNMLIEISAWLSVRKFGDPIEKSDMESLQRDIDKKLADWASLPEDKHG